jgi:hypothetical protein
VLCRDDESHASSLLLAQFCRLFRCRDEFWIGGVVGVLSSGGDSGREWEGEEAAWVSEIEVVFGGKELQPIGYVKSCSLGRDFGSLFANSMNFFDSFLLLWTI